MQMRSWFSSPTSVAAQSILTNLDELRSGIFFFSFRGGARKHIKLAKVPPDLIDHLQPTDYQHLRGE